MACCGGLQRYFWPAGNSEEEQGATAPASPGTSPQTLLLPFGPGLELYVYHQAVRSEGEKGKMRTFLDSTGTSPWSGGLQLAAWLGQAGSCLKGLRVLELGSGANALPCAAACRQGASVVHATDGLAANVTAAQGLLARNGCKAAKARCLQWGERLEKGDEKAWDVLLFADTVYTLPAAELLAATIDELLGPEGMVFGALGHRLGCPELLAEMRRRSFVAERLPAETDAAQAAQEAGTALRSRMEHDAMLSMTGARNECLLVRFMRKTSAQHGKSDVSLELQGEVAFKSRQDGCDADQGWVAWE